jgi:hypothetical protein
LFHNNFFKIITKQKKEQNAVFGPDGLVKLNFTIEISEQRCFLTGINGKVLAQIPSSVLTESGSMGMISARCFQAPLL